jgi:hypothetical protein
MSVRRMSSLFLAGPQAASREHTSDYQSGPTGGQEEGGRIGNP